MIEATLDANVIASGLLGYRRETSAPGTILRLWIAQSYLLITSDHLLMEVKNTINEPYFLTNVEPAIRTLMMTALDEQAIRTPLTAQVTGVASHPEDDLVLATAVSAAADYLVTGDRQLLKVGVYEGVAIVSPRDFLDILGLRTDDPS